MNGVCTVCCWYSRASSNACAGRAWFILSVKWCGGQRSSDAQTWQKNFLLTCPNMAKKLSLDQQVKRCLSSVWKISIIRGQAGTRESRYLSMIFCYTSSDLSSQYFAMLAHSCWSSYRSYRSKFIARSLFGSLEMYVCCS
jgi:hypothetical protein